MTHILSISLLVLCLTGVVKPVISAENILVPTQTLLFLAANGFPIYEQEAESEHPLIKVKRDQSTFLYCSRQSRIDGNLTLQPGKNRRWSGSGGLTWTLQVPGADSFDVYLIADIPAESEGAEMVFATTAGSFVFGLKPTTGPWLKGRNFQRVKVLSGIPLQKGIQEVALSGPGIGTNSRLMDIRSVELVPVNAYQAISKNEERASAARADIRWMSDSGYGLMFHWTSQSVQSDGSKKTFDSAVKDFDVTKFGEMVNQTGAGYVMFTIGHAEQYCPAPIKAWEILHPSKTTSRDLIMEIADELGKYDIRLMLYLNSPLLAGLGKVDTRGYYKNHKAVLSEIGNRYKQKIAGYWIDSWYQGFEEYPDFNFKALFRLFKIGNRDRVFCLNSWIYPAVTPWQEYWAGETASPVALPQNGFMKDGPVPDLPYHALLIMEPYWVQEKAEMPDPRFTAEELGKYITECQENGGAVTVNLGIYQDGTVGQKALQVMKEVRAGIRKN
jgi:hypothetical protein